ncbi:BQ5605_C023g09662 [Microbotryum silenes-dioicae]|uniref:BQ5605_C023g09662 protein n=1 Tax=Microbotryum silenes-dioicae TaxID=796604 RepID=A0A2X0MNV6_9BASI|nr:BQ5605_C023g09662 [Microbotryum silenes-dioicae]
MTRTTMTIDPDLPLFSPTANRPQVYRWQSAPQATRRQGRPQVGARRRWCEEASPRELTFYLVWSTHRRSQHYQW